jgi:hypothetical protein
MYRRNVKKVDEQGKPIRGSLKTWKTKNPGKLYFDSKPEWECWKYMKSEKIKNDFQPTIELFATLKTKEFKKGVIKEITQRAIKYTPDFYLHKYKVYIEVKGYADELFRVRWKLFKLQGYEGYIVYSLAELKTLLNQLNNDTKK